MSDNESESEQQQQMEKIFICDDIWLEVFAFLDPFELGLKMALISDRLDVLVDVHLKLRKWSLGSMVIVRAIERNGAQIVKLSGERLPIPQGPPQGKVIGFKCIVISYVDQTVIEFLQRIRRFFESSEATVCITTLENQSRSWEIIWQNIWPLVNDKICGFPLDSELDCLRQFSPTILRNCPNLRSIESSGLFPEFPAEDNAGASSHQALAKWLITPRGDGLPKMLSCGFYSARMEALKWVISPLLYKSFVDDSEPAIFIIRLRSSSGFEPFELTNNLTRERLTFRFIGGYGLLVRCPIGREEDKWTNWEREAIQWQWNSQWNCIGIRFEDNDIGDGMIGANEGQWMEGFDRRNSMREENILFLCEYKKALRLAENWSKKLFVFQNLMFFHHK